MSPINETTDPEVIAVRRLMGLIEAWLLAETVAPTLKFNDARTVLFLAPLSSRSAREWLARSPDAARLLAHVGKVEPDCSTLHMVVALQAVGVIPPV